LGQIKLTDWCPSESQGEKQIHIQIQRTIGLDRCNGEWFYLSLEELAVIMRRWKRNGAFLILSPIVKPFVSQQYVRHIDNRLVENHQLISKG
jgi:hypothetical protein